MGIPLMTNGSLGTIHVGSRIGPYQLVEQLGSGGAGDVFVAQDTETHEKFALKVMRPGAEMIEEIHARFIREIAVAQKLNDPHIVTYRDCGVEDGILYYAMEYVPWGSLSDVLRSRGSLPWRDACECAQQMAMALQHLHDLGIVHRDLKPANVFLSDSGRLKIGDFGLARDSDSPKLTVAGMTVGTCKYLSPEQAKGEDDIDQRADLYSLGCNLFELIVGRTPFETPDSYEAVTFIQMMRRHIEEPAPKLADIAPQCPAELSDLVARLLAKSRNQRPESAAAVAKELGRILEKTNSSDSKPGAVGADEEQYLTKRLRSVQSRNTEVSTGKLLGILAVLFLLITVAAVVSWGK